MESHLVLLERWEQCSLRTNYLIYEGSSQERRFNSDNFPVRIIYNALTDKISFEMLENPEEDKWFDITYCIHDGQIPDFNEYPNHSWQTETDEHLSISYDR